MDDSTRFDRAIALIDAANSEDPTREVAIEDGASYPRELLYSQRMSKCLERFKPDASEVLKLAVRAQHLQRWRIPRSDYPRDRAGYLRWRRQLGIFHAETCADLLKQAGYSALTIERVSDLLMKKQLKTDNEAQTLEDVACLVFIEYYLAEFAAKHLAESDPESGEKKLIAIIRKTWAKMSSAGQSAALELSPPDPVASYLQSALHPTE